MDAVMSPAGDRSLWLATEAQPAFPQVATGSRFDVLIIGGGIVGIATAYMLRESGLRVAVVEARSLLSGVTGHTTGKITALHDLIYADLKKTLGAAKARQYYDANSWGIEFVRQSVLEHNIDCDLAEDFACTYAMDDHGLDRLREEHEACLELGIPAQRSDTVMPFDVADTLRLDGQLRYHPVKFLRHLVQLAHGSGVQFFEDSRVTHVSEEKGVCVATLERGEVVADQIVVATNYPIYDSALFVARLAPYRSYACALEIEGDLPQGMCISTDEVRLGSFRRAKLGSQDLLICGYGHHKVGEEPNTDAAYDELLGWAMVRFKIREVVHQWSTQDNFTPDRVPFIGRRASGQRVLTATGFNGWGMAHGFVAGRILAAEILGQPSPWAELYSPGRFEWSTVPKLVEQNLEVVGHVLSRAFKPVQHEDLLDLEIGEASVVQLDDGPVAAYNAGPNELIMLDASCTHMGCRVTWNSAEKSWDCPCHGSRFSYDGHVLHGPATKPLQRLQ